jgi:hypothetical protein
LRKLITVAIAATATLAVATAGIAVAAPEPNDAEGTLTVTASPTKAGKKKKPKNVKLGFDLQVDKPGTTVEFIEMLLPKGTKISGKGFKKCNADDLAQSGPTACPSGSKAGPKGAANAAVVTSGVTTPLNFDVYPFVEDSNTLLFYLSQVPAGVQSVVKGEITNGGRKMRITIPQELRQPAPGLDATLTGIDQVFSAKAKKNYLVSSTSCPKGGWKFGGKLIFTERADGAPVPGPEERQSIVKCKK